MTIVPKDGERLLTIVIAAKLKGVSYNTINKAIKRGQIGVVDNIEGAVLIPESEVINFKPLKRYWKYRLMEKQNVEALLEE